QWAISTPVTLQTAAPTMAIKALAYGFRGVRCDGNDVFAVYACVKDAVDQARRGGGPTLVEALTYRVSAHSSSDDPTRYRDERITAEWRQRDPLPRFRTWMMAQGLLDAAADERMRAEIDAAVRDALTVHPFLGTAMLLDLDGAATSQPGQHFELWGRNDQDDIIRISYLVGSDELVGFQIRIGIDPNDPYLINDSGYLLTDPA